LRKKTTLPSFRNQGACSDSKDPKAITSTKRADPKEHSLVSKLKQEFRKARGARKD